MFKRKNNDKGSVEMITIALLAALIVVLAIPLLTSIGKESEQALTSIKNNMECANDNVNCEDETSDNSGNSGN